MKRFQDYQRAVTEAYKKKETEGSLPTNLARPTDASLRNECIDEFPSRYSDKDSETFKLLFGKAGNADEYYQKLKLSEPGIFKPLKNFLKGEIKKTQEKNIHLLAWMIDFEPRPFKPVDAYMLAPTDTLTTESLPEPTNATSNDPDTRSEDQTSDANEDAKNNKPSTSIDSNPKISTSDKIRIPDNWFPINLFETRKSTAITLFVVSGLCFFYTVFKPRFMYWNGNQFKSIAFYETVDSQAFIVPFDPVRFNHLKKLTNLKLIRRSSIGTVHYSKIDTTVEFYTTGGKNPEDTTRWLDPMTEYMYKKYVLKKRLKLYQNVKLPIVKQDIIQ